MKTVLKVIIFMSVIIGISVVLLGCECEHKYLPATCISGKVCDLCGDVEGEALVDSGHKWKEATCLSSMTCELCGATEGDKLGHKWLSATCEAPLTCERCSVTKGEKRKHLWINATCSEPKTCDYCGETLGDRLGHSWKSATCTEPKTCLRCGDTTGVALGHGWQEANCTQAKTCSRCKIKSGLALGHTYYGGFCSRCGLKDENFFRLSGSYATYYFLGIKTAQIKISECQYRVSGNNITINFKVQKTYDVLGRSHNEDYSFKWKLYNTKGVVIDSGTIYTVSLEKYEYDDNITVIINGIDLKEKYRFEIISNSLAP